jgi:hypothetical protein
MSQRTASTVSLLLSLILLLIFSVLTVIFELIALNGASESQGMSALGVSLACLGGGAILLGILAWKASGFFMTRFHMNPVLAVTLTVVLGMLVSGTLAFLSIMISIPLAGIR